VTCPIFEVVYGGARGGGKTDAAIGDFALHAKEWGPWACGLFIRRTLIALLPTIERAKQIYKPLGAMWQEQKSRFVWPNGAMLYFRYLDRDDDADNYQGHSYTRVYVEELTQFPSPVPLDKLRATLRSTHGVPTGYRATCNPGGPGHTWVKARYIDNGAYTVVRESFVNPFDGSTITTGRVFIPARLSDNPELLRNDPRYVANLFQAGSQALVKAWLEGDWNVVEGAFFDNWTGRNIIQPFAVPETWLRFRSFDWGYAAPFSCGWWTVVGDDMRGMPRGALLRYREWYGARSPNVGLRMTTSEVAQGILQRDQGETFTYSVADPSIFSEDGGPARSEIFAQAKVYFREADNKRVTGVGALGGWDEMRQRIRGQDERPMLYVFDTCRDFIRTVPSLPHDPKHAEDIDTNAEDHIADEARYACMSRPWAPIIRPIEPTRRDRYQPREMSKSWKVR
jgi:hypothetical protein